MHIGFLTPEFPHPETGKSAGLGSSIKTLAHSLKKEGVEVSVFIYGQNKNKEIEDEGLKLHMIEQRNYPLFGWILYRKFLEKYLSKCIKEDNIDLLEAPDWTGITAFMRLPCPLLIRMHGSDAYFCHLERREQKWKNYWFEKTALKAADHLLSVSQFTADKTREIFGLERGIIVIPNGVDIDQFVPGRIEIKEKTILYFGSLIRKKGVIELAFIFNKIIKDQPDAFLRLVGKDVVDILKKRSTLKIIREVLSEEAGARFEYIPEVPYEKISNVISSHAVVVFPSFAEAFPMSWLEAMAMGKALVTSKIGWAGEIMINGKTGFMADPKDHSEFAEKILKLVNDPKLRHDMGGNSRQRITAHFSAEVIAKKNIEFYQHAAEKEI